MTLNPYLTYIKEAQEGELLNSFVEESIQSRGQDFFYIRRTKRNTSNQIDFYGQDDMSIFKNTYILEMYLSDFEGFGGQGTFFNKLGMDVKDRITLELSRTRFQEVIGNNENISRPMEGDLIYFPLTGKIFEIVWTDPRALFYPLGSLPVLKIQCEVFEYNNEVFETGIPDIDKIFEKYSTDFEPHIEKDVNGNNIEVNGFPLIDALFHEEEHDVDFDNNVIIDMVNDLSDTDIDTNMFENPFK